MFGFGLKLKSKPKPTISAARRPRDQVVETSQKNDTIAQAKQSPNENNSQNSNPEKSEFERSERSSSTVVSTCVESVAHPASEHLEPEKLNTDCKKDEETPLKTDTSSSSPVISLANSNITNIDNDRNKTVPFIPKLFPKKNKFVPNVRAVRKTDDQVDKSTSKSPQKNSGSISNEAENIPVVAKISEPHVDSSDTVSKTPEAISLEMSVTIEDEVHNQTTSDQACVEQPPVAQKADSLHESNSLKEPLLSIKPVSEPSADKENTICNDDSQILNPLQNSKKKKQKAQGTFLQMTIEAKKELNEKLKDGKLDKSKLIMRDLILYNPTSNPMPVKSRSKGMKEEKKCKLESKSLEDEILSEQSVDDVEATRDSDAGGSMPVPQLKVGPDGKIILDSSTLVIETTGTEKSRTDLQNSELVEENEFSGFKYRKRRARRNVWSAEETLLFYKALNDLGADFSLMQSLFPSRSRRDLKLKFKKEERCNISLVDKAMTHVGKFNFEALKEEITRDREERSKRKEEETRLKVEAEKQLQLQRVEAKAKERRMKVENHRKLKDEQNKAKQAERNSRERVKRKKKLSTNKVKQPYKRSKKEIKSDSENEQLNGLYNFDKPDDEKMHYDSIFKTTKSGRSPRVRNKYLEQSEENRIKNALKTKKAADILREQLESVSQMDIVDEEEEEQELNSVNSEESREMEICLFGDPSNPGGTEELEEFITPNNEEHYDDSNFRSSISNVGSILPSQKLPETIKIVEELTSGISHGTVDVNGLTCKIITLNDDNELGDGSSAFRVRDSQEINSDFSLRLVKESAETNVQQLNYVISYDEENGESIELSSGMVTGGETTTNPLLTDHSYSMTESPGSDDDSDDSKNSRPECRSFVVLEPNDCVEIYNDS